MLARSVGEGDSRDNQDLQDKLVIAVLPTVSILLNLDNRPEPGSNLSDIIIPRSLPAHTNDPPLSSQVNDKT